MKELTVEVQPDHLQSLTAGEPATALAELIWNGLDADASTVRVEFTRNDIGGIQAIRVVDDGQGMDYAAAEPAFSKLGDSWKRARKNARKTTDNGRALHGEQGKGRFRAFALGTSVVWRTTYREQMNGLQTYEIKGGADLKRFILSDPMPATNANHTGTAVEIGHVHEHLAMLQTDAIARDLESRFAFHLLSYPDLRVIVDESVLDARNAAIRRHTFDLPHIQVEGGEYVGAQLTVIEWKDVTSRTVHLCDAGGLSLHSLQPGFQTPGFRFTAYLRCDYFRRRTNDLAIWSMFDPLREIVEVGRARLREYFKEREYEERRIRVQNWKDRGIYPFAGEPQSPLEQVEREVFDVVALSAVDRLPAVREAERELGFTLALLREAIATKPTTLGRIFSTILKLPVAQQAELRELLERVTLEGMMNASRIVITRLEFLKGLEELLFDQELRKKLKERSQLHELVAANTWLFGEEYNLSASDESLTRVLEAHQHLLGGGIGKRVFGRICG